jgi:hypothetical protein
MTKIHRTTQAEFARFKKAFLRTRRALGMTSYGVRFELRRLNSSAEIEIWFQHKHCVARLNSHMRVTDATDDLDFEAHGVHEACHLFLGPLSDLGGARYCGPEDIKEKEEEMVRIMEDLLHLSRKEKQ